MRQAARQYTLREVDELNEHARFGSEVTCPVCDGLVDCAEVKASEQKGTGSATRRFSFVCTVCSSHGEYKFDALAQH